jgi:hypothetical protein
MKKDHSVVSMSGEVTFSELLPKTDRYFTDNPTLGIVIGTFAAIPYVHLHLEARRRFYPNVPVLVHDDFSPAQAELRQLCKEYAVDFETDAFRFEPCKGDLAAMACGLLWAKERSLQILVKMSRRFVPVSNWTDSLKSLAVESQYPTFSHETTTFGFGFRTECVGFAVMPWIDRGLEDIASAIVRPGSPFVEGFIHDLARRLAARNGYLARAYDDRIGHRPPDKDGYAPWEWMGNDRAKSNRNFIWHDSDQPWVYHRVSESWGLPYKLKDFEDPNMGFGEKP